MVTSADSSAAVETFETSPRAKTDWAARLFPTKRNSPGWQKMIEKILGYFTCGDEGKDGAEEDTDLFLQFRLPATSIFDWEDIFYFNSYSLCTAKSILKENCIGVWFVFGKDRCPTICQDGKSKKQTTVICRQMFAEECFQHKMVLIMNF